MVFCTNHAMSPDSKIERLRTIGVPDPTVVTSADAVAALCAEVGSALVMGDRTLVEHLGRRGVSVVAANDLPDGGPVPPVSAVVVGAVQEWDRSRIGLVADAVRGGARFLATNDDATFPTSGPDGLRLLPGNGALVAAVAVTAGRPAEVAGKPHRAMADAIERRHGPVDVVVGDRPGTDGEFARALGARFGLVLSGVTASADLPVEPRPWAVAEDLAALVGNAPTL